MVTFPLLQKLNLYPLRTFATQMLQRYTRRKGYLRPYPPYYILDPNQVSQGLPSLPLTAHSSTSQHGLEAAPAGCVHSNLQVLAWIIFLASLLP